MPTETKTGLYQILPYKNSFREVNFSKHLMGFTQWIFSIISREIVENEAEIVVVSGRVDCFGGHLFCFWPTVF